MIEALTVAMRHYGATTFRVVAHKQVKLYLHDNYIATVLLYEDGSWERMDKSE